MSNSKPLISLFLIISFFGFALATAVSEGDNEHKPSSSSETIGNLPLSHPVLFFLSHWVRQLITSFSVASVLFQTPIQLFFDIFCEVSLPSNLLTQSVKTHCPVSHIFASHSPSTYKFEYSHGKFAFDFHCTTSFLVAFGNLQASKTYPFLLYQENIDSWSIKYHNTPCVEHKVSSPVDPWSDIIDSLRSSSTIFKNILFHIERLDWQLQEYLLSIFILDITPQQIIVDQNPVASSDKVSSNPAHILNSSSQVIEWLIDKFADFQSVLRRVRDHVRVLKERRTWDEVKAKAFISTLLAIPSAYLTAQVFLRNHPEDALIIAETISVIAIFSS
jgi:hypothetical protein